MNCRERGFTLIELVVVVAIMSIVTSIVLFNYHTADSQAAVGGMTNAIDLTLHQAQVYATSVQGYTPAGGTQNFTSAYGVFFSTSAPDGFILFAKLADDPTADAPTYTGSQSLVFTGTKNSCNSNDNCLQRQTFNPGYVISGICAGANASSCSTQTDLSVMYNKTITGSTIEDNSGNQYDYAKITLRSPAGEYTKSVEVWSNGVTKVD